MNRIRMAGTDIETTVLGFGCGQLLRVGSARERRRLLDLAYETGIRHFDVARSYGLGAAEGELGRFARDKRDQVVLATKFGIGISRRGRAMRMAQGAGRRVLSAFPFLRRAIRGQTGMLLEPRRYGAADARASLETSLRELGTDHVELFLLHDPRLEDVVSSDVLEFLEGARARGTIRAYGVAGAFGEVVRICREVPALGAVVQFPSDAISHNRESFSEAAGRTIATYAPLSSALEAIRRRAGADALSRQRWRDAVGVDCASSDAVASLLLRHAVHANPGGIVLFSTTRPERLQALVDSVQRSVPDEAVLSRFAEQVDRELPRPR